MIEMLVIGTPTTAPVDPEQFPITMEHCGFRAWHVPDVKQLYFGCNGIDDAAFELEVLGPKYQINGPDVLERLCEWDDEPFDVLMGEYRMYLHGTFGIPEHIDFVVIPEQLVPDCCMQLELDDALGCQPLWLIKLPDGALLPH